MKKKGKSKMLEIKSSPASQSTLASLKGSEGYSIGIQSLIWTPFGVQRTEAVKNLTHEEAMQLRDDLNKHYPIIYSEVISVQFLEVD